MKILIYAFIISVAAILAASVLVGAAWYHPWTKIDYVSCGPQLGRYSAELQEEFPARAIGGVWFDAHLTPAAEGAFQTVGPWRITLTGYSDRRDLISVDLERIEIANLVDKGTFYTQEGLDEALSLGDSSRRIVLAQVDHGFDTSELGTGINIRLAVHVKDGEGTSEQGVVAIDVKRIQTSGYFQVPQL